MSALAGGLGGAGALSAQNDWEYKNNRNVETIVTFLVVYYDLSRETVKIIEGSDEFNDLVQYVSEKDEGGEVYLSSLRNKIDMICNTPSPDRSDCEYFLALANKNGLTEQASKLQTVLSKILVSPIEQETPNNTINQPSSRLNNNYVSAPHVPAEHRPVSSKVASTNAIPESRKAKLAIGFLVLALVEEILSLIMIIIGNVRDYYVFIDVLGTMLGTSHVRLYFANPLDI